MENGSGNVRIGGDAEGNVIVTGDSNRVVIIHASRVIEPGQKREATAIGPNPYKGLGAFQERDANYFFGREDLTKHLWAKFRDLHEQQPSAHQPARILPILGPSGSGKSSVARAGLIPELARHPMPGRESPRVAIFTPGAHPLESLAAILARVTVKDEMPVAKVREFVEQLRLATQTNLYDGLRRIADAIPDISNTPLIILVDQFEEIYSLCDDTQERDIFIANLLTAARDRSGHISIIVTLRTDFIGETNSQEELNRIISTQGIIVPVMNREELTRAIAEPARRAGHPLDDATVELLINETKGREGVLPLLQFALTRIWEGMAQGVAPSETLRQIGGVGGALAVEAQRLYEGLQNEADKALARRVFLSLVRVGKDIPTTRRTLAIDDLVAQSENVRHVREVVERFASPGARILTLSADAEGAETARITHEALIEHWEQFEEWIRAAYDDLLFQYRLEDAARYWNEQGQPAGLLWRSPDLDRLRAFRRSAERNLTGLQIKFADASEKAAQWSRVNKISAIALPVVLLIASIFAFWKIFTSSPANNNNAVNSGQRSDNSENNNLDVGSAGRTTEDDVPLTAEEISALKTAEEISALKKIKSDVTYAVQVLNMRLQMGLPVPKVTLIRESIIDVHLDGFGTYNVSVPVKDLPELTYHEIAHAFIEKIVRFNFTGQSGSIVESYADIYAERTNQRRLNQTAQQADWEIAPGAAVWVLRAEGREDSTITDAERKAPLRSMKAPGTAYDHKLLRDRNRPAHMKDFVTLPITFSDDWGGVHINIGIPNKGFYEAAIRLGSDKAGTIWTQALRHLTPDSDFQTLANTTFKVAAELYGEGSQEQRSVREAWGVVGIAVSQ